MKGDPMNTEPSSRATDRSTDRPATEWNRPDYEVVATSLEVTMYLGSALGAKH
jgi:coenzyme PQQ precursor peptide PqqA